MEHNQTAKKTVLGKGMAALFQNNGINVDTYVNSNSLDSGKRTNNDIGSLMIPIEKIEINPSQPRKVFKEKEIEELAQSIRENGIIQPMIVSQNTENTNYTLIAGERRYRAAKIVGLEHVPVIVKRSNKKEQMIMSIIENVQRSDLNCVEEALAYYQLMEEFNLTQEEVAKKIGKERSTIANFLRILKLPKEVVMMLQKELLSFGHAKLLVSLKDDGDIIRLANIIVAKGYSVRDLENVIKNKGAQKASGPIEPTNSKSESERYFIYQQKIERKTGVKTKIKAGKSGMGCVQLNYSNQEEFKKIYELLMGIN